LYLNSNRIGFVVCYEFLPDLRFKYENATSAPVT